MSWPTRLLAAGGILAATAAPVILSTPAQALRMGGSHGGMGFHGGFHDGFHHHHGFFPRFGTGLGLGALYGTYGWPGYSYDAYPDYGYPSDPYYPSYGYPYPYPYYGGGYPTPAPYASGYGGGYPTPALGSISSHGPSVEPNLPPAEIRPPAPQAPDLVRRPPKPAPSDNAADPRLPDVRLTGIVIERDRRIAIFDVTGTRPLVLSEGEALKDWRLDNISPQKVSLSGPAGTITLEPKADPNLVRPPPPAGAAATASP
jgi:hypothetical protein